jgi:hypothetical protein
MGVKSPWRAYLDLDFRVTENRRSDKVLDTLKQKYRRMGAPHRGQHKTQRGVGVFVVVDIENFLSSAKTFHQGRKLTPGAPSTIVRARELLVASHIFRLASRDAAKPLLSTLVSESSGECRAMSALASLMGHNLRFDADQGHSTAFA